MGIFTPLKSPPTPQLALCLAWNVQNPHWSRNAAFPSFIRTLFKDCVFSSFSSSSSSLSLLAISVFLAGMTETTSFPRPHTVLLILSRALLKPDAETRCYIYTHTLNREPSTAHSCLVARLRRAAARTPITAWVVWLSRTCRKAATDRAAPFLSLSPPVITCTEQDWLTPLTVLSHGAGCLSVGQHKSTNTMLRYYKRSLFSPSSPSSFSVSTNSSWKKWQSFNHIMCNDIWWTFSSYYIKCSVSTGCFKTSPYSILCCCKASLAERCKIVWG